MRFLIIAFFAFLSSKPTGELHESVSATFNVIEKGHVLMLEIDFDMSNYLKVNSKEINKITKDSFGEYLNNTTSWEFDGEKIIPEVLSIKPSGHHCKVVCFLSNTKKNIKQVKIRNEFLLNIKSHSNIVMLDINNSFKDFRLHKERTEIIIDY